MGIRCYCPNGHRLNLKAFLAGRVGVCPKCDARFRIPLESEPKREDTPSSTSSQPAAVIDTSVTPQAPMAQAADPTASPVVPNPGAPVEPAMDPIQPAEPTQPMEPIQPIAEQPTAPVQPIETPQAAPQPSNDAYVPAQPTPAPSDPIAEAPELVWYVRPPSGGEFGPAKGDIMQRWIDEGRVTPDSLVWRQGWPEWQPANQAIPSLNR